jgi:hypothetical protein
VALADDAIDDGACHIHRLLGKVDVAPFQTEQLALPQASGYCQEDQRSFSTAQIVDQRLDFNGHQDGRRSAALRTLTNKVDGVPVKQLISASMIKKEPTSNLEFWRNCFSPKASVEAKIQLVLF